MLSICHLCKSEYACTQKALNCIEANAINNFNKQHQHAPIWQNSKTNKRWLWLQATEETFGENRSFQLHQSAVIATYQVRLS